MKEKSQNTDQTWIDPDDAPELTDEFFRRAVYRIGDKIVTPDAAKAELAARARSGRPRTPTPKQPLTVRYDAEIISAFKATGKGWQTRMNDALRDWLKTHSPA